MKQLAPWEAVKLFCFVFAVMYSTLYFTKEKKDINSAERIFVGGVTEIIKAAVCCFGAYWKENGNGYGKSEYMPEYVVCGILSSFQSFSWIHAGQKFPTFILQIFGHGKIFFVYILARIVLKRRYTVLQSISQVILILGISIPLLSEVVFLKRTTLLDQSVIDYFLLMCLPVSSAFSGIYFEKSIVKKIGSKWKNAVNYSVTSSFVSFMVCGMVCMCTSDRVRYDKMGDLLFVSFIKSFDSLLFGYIVIYYSTLIRVFVTIIASTVISIIMSYQFKEEITPAKGLSMTVTILSIILFHVPYYFRRPSLPRSSSESLAVMQK